MRAGIEQLGRLTEAFVGETGRLALMSWEVIRTIARGQIPWGETVRQIDRVGIRSLPVVLLTGAFTGMVMAAQTYFQFKKVQMETAVGPVVSLSMTREVGPVFAALMVAGRVGAAMAAELGTMKVTEQVDALRAFAAPPVRFLVVPRFLATMISMPLLTAAVMVMGILCGRFVAQHLFGIDAAYFDANMEKYTHVRDVASGLIKAGIFAAFVSLISCYKGLNCLEGAEGVGRATTEAVVVGSVSILISNFFITYLLNFIMPP